jgi:transmembrane sensor
MIEQQESRDAERDTLDEAAAEWLVRLQDRNVSLEDTLEWQRWVGANERHATAFARIESVWDEPWEILQKPNSAIRTSPRGRGAVWAVAAAVALVAVASGWMLWQNISADGIQTDVGQTRSVQLADGSRITLGGGTQLRVSFDSKTRRLDLTRGEAFFVVAKDPMRPFSVHAGNATVTAIGTEFNVRRSADRVVVAVVEGRVSIEPTSLLTAADKPVPLAAGQQTVVDGRGVKPVETLADTAAATAWQSGQLVFRREPLRYVLEDVNRYSNKPIVLGDGSLGEMRITGTVVGGSVEGWIASLENAFPLRAVEQPQQIVLERTHE